METGWAKNQEAEIERNSVNPYGGLGAKYSDLLDMHEANCNMVILCKNLFLTSEKPVKLW